MSTFRFQHRLRVRWVEVDAQQVVFNGHYLTYLDVAVSEYWRQVGLPYPGAWQAMGADIYVRRNALDYHAPARLDDWLTVGVRAHRVGGSSLTLAWVARRGGQLLVDGEVVYVCVGLHDGRPMRLPDALPDPGLLVGWSLGASRATLASLAPKSVTSPVAMGIAEKIGGIPSLTAVLVAATGIIGAASARSLFNAMRISDPTVRGFALGTAAHGIGTARAFQVSDEMGAFAGLAMGLSALFSAVALPLLGGLLLRWL